MKHSLSCILFLTVAAVLCLSLSVGMLLAGPSEPGANEQLSDAPVLLAEDGGLNTGYLTDLTAYIQDRFFLRQELISLDHWLSAKLLDTSGDTGVILGQNGWLYYADTLEDFTGTNSMTERELFSAANNLALMAAYCDETEKEFLFVIAPNKNSLYPEHMPQYGVRAEQTDATRLMAVLNELQVPTVDLFSAFRAEEAPVYFAHDSHWNTKGAALGADLINSAFGVESHYYAGDFSQTLPHSGDLYTMLYPAFTDPEQDYVYGGTLSYSFTTSATKPDAIALNTESTRSGSLLAYRDSFGNLLFPFLADSYGTAKFSRSTTYDLTGDADYVLIELVERNLRYLIQNIPIIAAPAAELELPEHTQGVIQASASQRGDLVRIQGSVPEPDPASKVYVVSGGNAYEAFCLEKNGFGLYLEPDVTPEYVVCSVNGTLAMFKIEI